MTAEEISKQFATNSDDEQALKNFIEQYANEKVKEYQEIVRRTDKLIQEDGGGVMLAKFEVIAMEVLTNNSK